MDRRRRQEFDPPPTVFDRLVAKTGAGTVIGSRSRDSFTDSVIRDLQLLLNSRREELLIPVEFEQCTASILNFGIADLTRCGSLQSATEQSRLCRSIEDSIRIFEPRLRRISVRLLDSEGRSTLLRFRLEAIVEFTSERLSFEMALKRDTGEVSLLPN